MHAKNGAVSKYVDLHIHSTFSDGASSVYQLLSMARDKKLRAISITDHDNIEGNKHALQLGSEYGLEIITGIELSCEVDKNDIHILGYFIDIENIALKKKLQELKEARYLRAKKIVHNLNQQGIDLRFETVLKIAGEGAIGRPHIATAMLNEELIYSFKEAFDKYIGYNSPAYVDKMKLSPKEVFSLILDSGGLPILAHPGITDNIDEDLDQFIEDGLIGLEVYHSEHSAAMKKHYKEYCIKKNLEMSGGSDFHSRTQTRAEIGLPRVSYTIVEKLKSKLKEVHGERQFHNYSTASPL